MFTGPGLALTFNINIPSTTAGNSQKLHYFCLWRSPQESHKICFDYELFCLLETFGTGTRVDGISDPDARVEKYFPFFSGFNDEPADGDVSGWNMQRQPGIGRFSIG